MNRSTLLSAIALFAAIQGGTPAAAQDQRIHLDAGLWEYSISLNVHPHGVVNQETQTFCIDEASANMTADEIVRRLSHDQCRASNAVLTTGTGSAQMSCVYPEENARGDGEFRASYTSTTYEIQAEMRFVGPGGTTSASFLGNARRIGDCS